MTCERCHHLHTRIDESVSRPITTYSCTFHPQWMTVKYPDIHYCGQFEDTVMNTQNVDLTNVKQLKRKKK